MKKNSTSLFRSFRIAIVLMLGAAAIAFTSCGEADYYQNGYGPEQGYYSQQGYYPQQGENYPGGGYYQQEMEGNFPQNGYIDPGYQGNYQYNGYTPPTTGSNYYSGNTYANPNTNSQMSNWQSQQSSIEANHSQFIDYIRGEDRVQTANGNVYKVESGYDNTYINQGTNSYYQDNSAYPTNGGSNYESTSPYDYYKGSE